MSIQHKEIAKLVAASQDLDVVFSFVEESDEHLFYVTAVYASEGSICGVHRKVYLPTYGLFDEGRNFAPGWGFHAFASRFGRVGMMICEDAWHLSSPYLLSLQGVDLLIVISASPARSVTDADRFGSHQFWRRLLETYSSLLGMHIVFVNRVGFEDGVSFFGGSGIITPDGIWDAEAPALAETMIYGRLDPRIVRRSRYATPILRDEKQEMVWRQLGGLLKGVGVPNET
jgi:predicted amidohydrolase